MGVSRWEVTVIGRDPPPDLRRALEAEARILREERRGEAVVRFTLEGDLEGVRPALLDQAHREGYDLAVLEEGKFLRPARLVVFDMDSTLVTIEVIDELARAAGRYEEVAKITERAMRGELDFEQSLRARVALLAGTPEEVLMRIARSLPLTEGAGPLVKALNRLGIRVAVLSGGFTPGVEALRARLGLDHAHANHLEVREGRFTGGLVGPIVGAERKAALLKSIAEEEGADLRQVVAVGDGANDRLMLAAAGIGVAFRAKPALREVADVSLGSRGLDTLLYVLGLSDAEIAALHVPSVG